MPSPERELFHYTTAQGLLVILESNSVRATNALYMNDASERQHGQDLLRKVLDEQQKRSRSPLFKAYCEATKAMVKGLNTGASYVFCLSSEGNQLSQWRAYAA